MTHDYDYVRGLPNRTLSALEFEYIGRAMLLWGLNEQNIGGIAAVAHGVSGEAAVTLVHSLPYGRKVDLACAHLAKSTDQEQRNLGKELDFIRTTLRPERDTIAHGAVGMWADEAWVRAIAKPRFVMADDFGPFVDRAAYAFHIAAEASMRAWGGIPNGPRPPRPPLPEAKKPLSWGVPLDEALRISEAARKRREKQGQGADGS